MSECCRQVEAGVISNSRNKLHQTTYKEIFSALCANLTSKVLRLKAGPDISMPKEKLALPDLVSASGRPKVVENPVARDCRSQLSLSLSAYNSQQSTVNSQDDKQS